MKRTPRSRKRKKGKENPLFFQLLEEQITKEVRGKRVILMKMLLGCVRFLSVNFFFYLACKSLCQSTLHSETTLRHKQIPVHDASLMHKTHVRDFEAILDTLSNLTLSILDAVKPGTSASGYSRLLTSEKKNEKREVKRRK